MSFMLPATTTAGRKRRQSAIRNASDALPTQGEMLANIRRILHEADGSALFEWSDAHTWYHRYQKRLHRLAYSTGVSPTVAVGIFAALSPSTDIDRNYQLTKTMLLTGDCAHAYGDAVRKARSILNGAHPSQALGGRKVRSFYRNLMLPFHRGAVTVDRHAISIAYGRPLSDAEAKVLQRPGAYQLVAACYRTAAHERNMLPHQAQAITWTFWRAHYAYGATTNVEEF